MIADLKDVLMRATGDAISSDVHDALKRPADFLRPGISLEKYADAVRRAGLTAEARASLDDLPDDAGMSAHARGDLLNMLLEESPADGWQKSHATQQEVLGNMYRRLPYYSTRIPERRRLSPRRVEVESPIRIDLGMGGLSDLPPWTNEQRGRAVSMCALVDGATPIHCVAELADEPGLWFHAEGRTDDFERIADWKDLDAANSQTAVIRASIRHLLGDAFLQASLDSAVAAVFGSGIRIKISSAAAKGLGSSTIIAASITQALLRLLGREPEWQDVIHRTVSIERRAGVGGGWEDALPPFFAGIVQTRSTPARVPVLEAESIEVANEFLLALKSQLILFDTQLPGYTGDVLAEATLRYLSGDESSIKASLELLGYCDRVVAALEAQNIAQLGHLFSAQWDAWKRITGGACTAPELEALLDDTRHMTLGAKPNGAGVGGAVLFAVAEEKRDQLLDYLATRKGQVISWELDKRGYRIKEWYQAASVRQYIQDELPSALRASTRADTHGDLVSCEVSVMSAAPDTLVGPVNPAIFDVVFDVPFATLAVAAAVTPLLASAEATTLSSTKKLIDATADAVFREELAHWGREVAVASSEAKDEYGNTQPGGSSGSGASKSRLRLAVDVVDGTTCAATGQPGAYSICAVADGLSRFPDLQAYAILAPKGATASLDLTSRPEDVVMQNVDAIARALGKQVGELTIVSHSTDTGLHHTTLIEKMRSAGVNVVIPEPVIVEPPYVAATCLREHIDGMIGVFGLPEIAINTILAGALNRGYDFLFRVASNQPLKNRTATTLDGIFHFSKHELEELAQSGVDIETVYNYEHVIGDGGAIFAGTAITDDPVLGIRGARTSDTITSVTGWLADPCGNAHRFSVKLHRAAEIDYTARYTQPLFDISLVVPLESAEAGLLAADRLEQLSRELRHVVPGVYIQPRSDSRDGRVGLHVTLFEFAVEHFSSIEPDSAEADDLMREATEIVTAAMSTLTTPLRFDITRVQRTRKGVHALVDPDDSVKSLVERLHAEVSARGSFPGFREPARYHVTLARFTEVPATSVAEQIDRICDEFNRSTWPDVYVRQAWLRRASATPFRAIKKDVAFFIAD